MARRPVVVTLHDLHYLTGGCHYPQDCDRWRTGCGQCPQLGRDPKEGVSGESWRRKSHAYGHPGELVWIATSRWSRDIAAASPLTRDRPVHLIPVGVDAVSFAPRDRTAARDILGIPSDAEVVLFVAERTDNPRKGLDLLAAAVSRLAHRPKLRLVSVGQGAPRVPEPVRHQHLGPFSDDRLLSVAYSAADIFAIPSREEAFGQTTLEAFSCGVPVVGSEVGGIPDLLQTGQTGMLVKPGDSAAFAEALEHLLEDPAERVAMGRRGRNLAVQAFSMENIAHQHLALYRSIVE